MVHSLATQRPVRRNRHRWRKTASARQHYNYFRDYDPRTGRYVQSDPIGLTGGISTFSYVSSRPLGGIDPYGLFQFAERPLISPRNPASLHIPGFNSSPAHEHGFYSDGRNVGFFADGVRSDTPEFMGKYTRFGPYYEDGIMAKAETNLRNLGLWQPDGTDSGFDYDLVGRNCQDFADALRDEYFKLGGKTCAAEFFNGKCLVPDLSAL